MLRTYWDNAASCRLINSTDTGCPVAETRMARARAGLGLPGWVMFSAWTARLWASAA